MFIDGGRVATPWLLAAAGLLLVGDALHVRSAVPVARRDPHGMPSSAYVLMAMAAIPWSVAATVIVFVAMLADTSDGLWWRSLALVSIMMHRWPGGWLG